MSWQTGFFIYYNFVDFVIFLVLLLFELILLVMLFVDPDFYFFREGYEESDYNIY